MVTESPCSIGEQIESFTELTRRMEQEIGKVIAGQHEAVSQVLTAILAGGHVLLEGVPGLGKTALVRALSQLMDVQFSRIQFTPDLMPADILGTNIISEDTAGRRGFIFQPGPVFANLVLADEVNRATPKTQSALLEAMQERTVTAGGATRTLPEPFFVMATQNPLEMEGTYPLPEAQLDRFLFKVMVPFPDAEVLLEIADRTTGGRSSVAEKVVDGPSVISLMQLARQIPLAEPVARYAVRLVTATHPDRTPVAAVRQYARYGSSPRGLQALILAGKVTALRRGRYNVAFADIREVALPALRHRLVLSFEGEAAGQTADSLINEIMDQVPEYADGGS